MTTKAEPSILRTSRAFAGYSVDDLAKAKKFYGDTLGLDAREEQADIAWFKVPAGNILSVLQDK